MALVGSVVQEVFGRFGGLGYCELLYGGYTHVEYALL